MVDYASRTREVTEENVDEVSGWVVQLSYQTDQTVELEMNMEELGEELQRLIKIMIDHYLEEK